MGCFPCFVASGTKRKASGLKESEEPGQTFTFHELECVIGERVLGRVYKGRLPNGQVLAVKQIDVHEFMTEVEMLSFFRHPNLVNLIGYCNEGDRTLLLYEFMPLGSLEDHLHGYFPKLSNFGLAILGPTGDKSHILTKVKGTYGYVAPEYALTGQATVKSDVYNFGVVFLELITGRKAFDSTQPEGQQNLVAWARPLFNDHRRFAKLVDPRLRGKFPMRGFYQALAVASIRIQEQADARPLIGEVVTALSYLANAQAYNRNSAPDSNRIAADNDERGGEILKNKEGPGSGRKWDLEGSEREDSP